MRYQASYQCGKLELGLARESWVREENRCSESAHLGSDGAWSRGVNSLTLLACLSWWTEQALVSTGHRHKAVGAGSLSQASGQRSRKFFEAIGRHLLQQAEQNQMKEAKDTNRLVSISFQFSQTHFQKKNSLNLPNYSHITQSTALFCHVPLLSLHATTRGPQSCFPVGMSNSPLSYRVLYFNFINCLAIHSVLWQWVLTSWRSHLLIKI